MQRLLLVDLPVRLVRKHLARLASLAQLVRRDHKVCRVQGLQVRQVQLALPLYRLKRRPKLALTTPLQ